jgi:hypothetical protein
VTPYTAVQRTATAPIHPPSIKHIIISLHNSSISTNFITNPNA